MSSPETEIICREHHFSPTQLAEALDVVARRESLGLLAQSVELLPFDGAGGATDFPDAAGVEELFDALADPEFAGLLLADVACAGGIWGGC